MDVRWKMRSALSRGNMQHTLPPPLFESLLPAKGFHTDDHQCSTHVLYSLNPQLNSHPNSIVTLYPVVYPLRHPNPVTVTYISSAANPRAAYHGKLAYILTLLAPTWPYTFAQYMYHVHSNSNLAKVLCITNRVGLPNP